MNLSQTHSQFYWIQKIHMVVPFLLIWMVGSSGVLCVRIFFIQVLKIISLTSASYEPISLLCKPLMIGRSVGFLWIFISAERLLSMGFFLCVSISHYSLLFDSIKTQSFDHNTRIFKFLSRTTQCLSCSLKTLNFFWLNWNESNFNFHLSDRYEQNQKQKKFHWIFNHSNKPSAAVWRFK